MPCGNVMSKETLLSMCNVVVTFNNLSLSLFQLVKLL